jgi:hypothetical protein
VTRAKRKFDEAVARYNELQPKVPRTYAEVVAGARSPSNPAGGLENGGRSPESPA